MSDVHWCCAGFTEQFMNRGLRGFGVVVERDELGEPWFLVECRVADDIEAVEISAPANAPVSLLSRTGIAYCPWCGRDLKSWYKDGIAAMATSTSVLFGG